MVKGPIQSFLYRKSSFAELRNSRQIYVDKTAMIFEMATLNQKFFLARPSGFGKTLLLSTFSSLFQFGLRDFKGLAIENLWEDSKNYLVVTIDLALIQRFKDRTEFGTRLKEVIVEAFSKVGFNYDPLSFLGLYFQLNNWIDALPSSSLVLLIDNYDAPLISCLTNQALLKEACGELEEFFAWIKSIDEVLRFLFVTGLTKIGRSSYFTGLNNVRDISLMPRFGPLVGFTNEELGRYATGQLATAGSALKMPDKKLLKELESNYGNFCFDKEARTKVLCSVSILSFLSNPSNGFENFWSNYTDVPHSLQKYIKGNIPRSLNGFREGICLEKSLLTKGPADPTQLETLVLLTQLGYLTIKESLLDSFLIGFPNKEVTHAFQKLCDS